MAAFVRFGSMKPVKPAENKHTVPAVVNAQELIRLLAEEEGETTYKALAARLRIPHSTCYRILRTLVAADWVRPVEGGRHVLSLGLLPLLKPLQQVEHLAELVEPELETLASQVRMTVKVSVRQGDYAATIARCESPRLTSVAVRVGASFHLAFGSSGAVLMSDLETDEIQNILKNAPAECWEHQKLEDALKRIKEVQAQGWCADAGTYRQSIHAISAPLRISRDPVLAVLTVIGFPHELPPSQLATPAKLLFETARRIEKILRADNSSRPISKGAKAKK